LPSNLVRARTGLDLDRPAHSESVFTLANGRIGLRGNLDEGDPHGVPGTYSNSFCELRPLPFAESGYGYPESGQAILNVNHGKLIRVLVDDEPLDIRYGQLRSHERVLDFRAGVLSGDDDLLPSSDPSTGSRIASPREQGHRRFT
jgi:alpha,alpha-trehalose phosphorylase